MPLDISLGRPALVDRIRQIIARDGPITFDRFMDLALYDPEDGYYRWRGDSTEPATGPAADFQTSPQVYPAFGHLIAVDLIGVWEALGRPRPFVVVEPGAGDGTLARQILAGFRERQPDLAVEYHAVDARLAKARHQLPADSKTAGMDALTGVPSGSLSQRERGWVQSPLPLGEGEGEGVSASQSHVTQHHLLAWPSLAALGEAGIVGHCVISNEFFDVLPVHRIATLDGRLREIYVDWSERGFIERVGDLSDRSLAQRVARDGVLPAEGWRGEVCLRLDGILATLAGRLDRGVILTIDYGYGISPEANEVSRGETLVSYHRHHWNDDVYRRVGEQDLTSHVDFAALLQFGRRHGLEPAGAMTQREFLRRRGSAAAVERWVASEPTPGRQWQARFALAELMRADGLGRLKVVAMQKGVPSYHLA